jgi:hypothetical protein
MTDLPGLESNLQESLQDDIETATQEMGQALKDEAEANFREYAGRNGYDIDHVWRDATVGNVSSGPGRASVTVEWPALTALFEWGVSPHTIEGNPLLHFYWEAKDQWITTDEVNWGSETGGIPESRAIRNALNYIRLRYERSVNL